MGEICLKMKKCSQKVLTIFKIEDTIKANIFLVLKFREVII